MTLSFRSGLAIVLLSTFLLGCTAAGLAGTASASNNTGSTQSQTFMPALIPPPTLQTSLSVDIHWIAGYKTLAASAHIAYHYCSTGPRFSQCSLYDGTGSDATMFGVEFVVSADTFKTFSDTEKALWSSKTFAVMSGLLVKPYANENDDIKAMQSTITKYGKIINFFQPGSNMPFKNSQAGYGLTSQAQLDQILDLADKMDKDCQLTTTYKERAAKRKGLITMPSPVNGTDLFKTTGTLYQYKTISYKVDKSTGLNP